MDQTQPSRQKSILFVDDEPNILQGLQRSLRKHRKEWDLHFANSGEEAQQVMQKLSFDLIITDLRMPVMNGVQLLKWVQQHFPHTMRFILSGHGNEDLIIQTVGVAHQFMAKPCDIVQIEKAITRACRLQDIFDSGSLQNIIKDGASLPTLPELYEELAHTLQSPEECTAGRMAEIISRDISVSAKVLQMVNSSFFGLSQRVVNITQAVTLLGAETISMIVLTTKIFNQFDEKSIREFNIRAIYDHSLNVARLAKFLTLEITKDQKKAEETMVAGLMHDIGILVAISSKNETWKNLYRPGDNMKSPLHEQEMSCLGTTHGALGAYLVGLWGLPDDIIDAIAFHHTPINAPDSKSFSILTAIHLAECIESIIDTGLASDGRTPDMPYLEQVGIADRIDELIERCRTKLGFNTPECGELSP
ncbi:MAG: HDOD domain-containing protein [Pontiellaceae bacterium]|nr:HDOD domain-containing protein [Pontiellaceae bacterium]MBN2786167.1 HDOD domain-containing protein [Pontiellaceae bacterium]